MMRTQIEEIIKRAIAEDLGDGDHSSLSCIPIEAMGKAQLKVKEKGILAGVELAKWVFNLIDPKLKVEVFISDGAHVKPGDIAFYVSGPTRSILAAERTALNFMQRMSGIATSTDAMVTAMNSAKCKLLDTRKTTPGIRIIEKWAVRIGGGLNHRMGLFDMIMLKDNHIDFAGGIEKAISRTHEYLKTINKTLKIEVEVRTLADVEEVLRVGGVDRIMLDNFTPQLMKEAVDLIQGKFETEASGMINLNNIKEYASTGVDFISSGSLTHQIKSIDLSLKSVI
jgi:nicotinate-nucleotide pyrophosphorylase (carboxylating)